MTTLPISTFAKRYSSLLEDAPDEVFVLERTGGKSPVEVLPAKLASGNRRAVSATAHVLLTALDNEQVRQVITAGLQDEYPWLAFLPKDVAKEFLHDALSTLRACAALGKFTAYERLLDSWQATAEVYADPELASRLQQPLEPSGLAIAAVD